MADKPETGEILGIPYNFQRPSLGRMLSAYWQPGKGMLVKKPFGIGYTLNLANWRSWVVVIAAGAMLWLERKSGKETAEEDEEGPVEVIVED